MKETTYDKTRRGHVLITIFGITTLAFLMLVSIAGAAPFAYIAHLSTTLFLLLIQPQILSQPQFL